MAHGENAPRIEVMIVKDPGVASNGNIRAVSIAQSLTRQGYQVAVVSDRLSTARPAQPNPRMLAAWQEVTRDRFGLYDGGPARGDHHFFVERSERASMAQTLTRLLPSRAQRMAVGAVIVSYPANRDVVEGVKVVIGDRARLIAECAAFDELLEYPMAASRDQFGVRTSNPAHEVFDPGQLVQYDKALFASSKSLDRAKEAIQEVLTARARQPEFLRALGLGSLDDNLVLVDRVSRIAEVTAGSSAGRHTQLDAQLMGALGRAVAPARSTPDDYGLIA